MSKTKHYNSLEGRILQSYGDKGMSEMKDYEEALKNLVDINYNGEDAQDIMEQSEKCLQELVEKETPLLPRVSINYKDGKLEYARANCKKCGAMLYQTCGLYPLKEALDGERPYCQHCGQKQSAEFSTNENDYNCGV